MPQGALSMSRANTENWLECAVFPGLARARLVARPPHLEKVRKAGTRAVAGSSRASQPWAWILKPLIMRRTYMRACLQS